MAQNKKFMINNTLDLSIKTDDLSEQIQDIVDVIGIDSTVKFIKEFGGEAVYFPKFDSIVRNSRNGAICKAFTGNNSRELSRKYNLSVRYIRCIIKQGRKKEKIRTEK